MGNSILLAQLLGPYLAIAGIGIFFNPKNCQQMAHEYTQSAALTYFGGVMALFFGLLIIQFHNNWAADWTVIITLFGWLGLVKGACLLLIPGQVKKFAARYYQGSTRPLIIQSLIIIAIGVLLMFKGYSGA
jgi:uncharacterized protein YjeT (DUF2065 family)